MPVLLATAYLPPARYMAEAVRHEEIVIEQFETYTKQTCRNHCAIYGPNGRQTLTVPVTKVNGNHTLTRDIRISSHEPWQRAHWRSIETAYNNSPFFLYYQDVLAPFYEKKFGFLLDLNTGLLETLLKALSSHGNVTATGSYVKNPAGLPDLRSELVAKYDLYPLGYRHYTQVFEPVHGFIAGLSIIDLLFNLGPETRSYLDSLQTGRDGT